MWIAQKTKTQESSYGKLSENKPKQLCKIEMVKFS